jgi:hypothetical protein
MWDLSNIRMIAYVTLAADNGYYGRSTILY